MGIDALQIGENRQCMDYISQGADFDDKNLQNRPPRRPSATSRTSSTAISDIQR
jgi:hypothetical protein